MVTIAHITKKILEREPFLEEALIKGIINYVALADKLQPEIEKELKKKVKTSAIMMALRRLSEKQKEGIGRRIGLKFKDTDITLKSDLFEITTDKTPKSVERVRRLYDIVDLSKGDFLTITHGVYQTTIISNKKHKKEITKILGDSIKIIPNLSSLTINIPLESYDTVGMFYLITKALAWANINIVEIVSTFTELTVILQEDDVPQSFKIMKKIIEQEN